MAQKKQLSRVEGFTHGLVTDPDPRFQIKGSYSKGQNIRLTNKTGETFTVENIDGNSLAIDLFKLQSQSYINATNGGILGTRPDINPQLTGSGDFVFSEIYSDPNNTDVNGNTVGEFFPSPQNPASGSPYSTNNTAASTNLLNQGIFPFYRDNLPGANQIGSVGMNSAAANQANIVGSVSVGNEIYLVIVIAGFQEDTTRTIFLRLILNSEQNIERVEDLLVCYSFLNDKYPELNMDIDSPIRLEALVENETITRLYWTDNKNPLRTLNVRQEGKNQLPPNTLNVTPMMKPSQPVLDKTVNGTLPTGVYQYTYKYISANGGETTFSPLSNMYHTSEEGFGSSTEYGGSPSGEVSSQGFRIAIDDVDPNFQFIELYALLYESFNVPPRVALVDRRNINNSANRITILHSEFDKEIENGLEEVLIETNTWDLCKDIAIKDNILFAANLRSKQNTVSEEEWNVKVLRYRIADFINVTDVAGAKNTRGMITSTDPLVKTYAKDFGQNTRLLIPSSQSVQGDYLLGENFNNDESEPKYGTLFTQRPNGNINYKTNEEYRFLQDGLTLGAESYAYGENELGGCRLSFGVKEKVADITTNDGLEPYINSIQHEDDVNGYKTDDFGALIQRDSNNKLSALIDPTDGESGLNNFEATQTTFKASMNLGGSKDPHLSGNQRGYQRGEFYRFGVQVYDLNGSPGNVLWIGDIQMPEMYDVLRMVNVDYENLNVRAFDPLEHSYNLSYMLSGSYTPQDSFFDGGDAAGIISHPRIKDHRLTHIYGHSVPPVDVCWFSGIGPAGSTSAKPQAYIYSNGVKVGEPISNSGTALPFDTNPASQTGSIRAKFYPGYTEEDNINNFHNDYHYLYDLYVNFEFIIPQEVCEKISGFRVVRAERLETEKRVLQQGLLNQTMKYGWPINPNATALESGYSQNSLFSVSDNENFKGGNNPSFPFVNDTNTPPTFIEYDSYLNGYIGLAENANLAKYDKDKSTGKLTIGGITAGKIGTKAETETSLSIAGQLENSQTYRTMTPADRKQNYSSHPGMGSPGSKSMHCAYFGSYEKCQYGQYSNGSGPLLNRQARIPEKLFTLDAPDSAFGALPYAFREGDILRIDTVLKLSDESRYTDELDNLANPSGTTTAYTIPTKYYNNGNGRAPTGVATAYFSEKFDGTETEVLRFASKRKIDLNENYGLLIGKYYSYETYWGIGMECGLGHAFGHDYNALWTGDSIANPKEDYRQYNTISSAVEISTGAVIPGSQFKGVDEFDTGAWSGFSNNTLGFIEDYPWYGQYSALHPTLYVDDGSGAREEDINYNTASTMQEGLRTIVLSVDKNPDGLDGSRYNFHPRNISMILQNQSFYSRNSQGALLSTVGNTQKDNYVLGNNESAQSSNSYIPFKYLCSIVRKNIPCGGSSIQGIEATRYIPCGNFHPVRSSELIGDNITHQFHNSKVFGGDTFVNLYSHQKTRTSYMPNSYARWQVFPVESFTNTDMRGNLSLNAGDTILGDQEAPPSNDWDYNEVYSQENNIKSGLVINERIVQTAQDLPYEIAYSNTKVLGEIGDAFRIFPINQFHDMEGQFGEINRIINFKNDIYVLQDEGFAKLLVNPLSVISDDTGQSLFTGTGDTVENHIYISTKFGSRHTHSVTTSEQALYFVDSRFARIFKYDTEKLISLGDSLGIRSDLTNIIKEEGDLDSFVKGYNNQAAYQTGNTRNYASDNPLKGLGINSIFDHKHKELMICFHNNKLEYDSNGNYEEANYVGMNVVYSEGLNAFTSYYTAYPFLWINGDPGIFTTQTEHDVKLLVDENAKTKVYKNLLAEPLKLWKWDSFGFKSRFFGRQSAAVLEKTISENPESVKVFDTAIIAMTEPLGYNPFIKFKSENLPNYVASSIPDRRYREGQLRFPLRGNLSGSRTRGQYLKIEFISNSPIKFNIFAIMAKYRKSYN